MKNQKIQFGLQNSKMNLNQKRICLDCDWSPLVVFDTTPVNKIHFLFLSTGCDCIFVTNHSNKLKGMITKEDFLKFKTFN